MYLTQNEGKSVVAGRFIIRILKNKFYKCITSVSRNVYVNELDEWIQQYISDNN